MQEVVKRARKEITIGSIIQLYTATQLYQGIVNTFLLIATAYNTTFRAWLTMYFPWVQFWMFISSIVIGQGLMMWLHKKLVLPSVVAYSNRCSWEHGNPQRIYFENQEKNMRRLMQKIGLEYEEIDKKALEALGIENNG